MDISQLPVAWANYLSILGFAFLGLLVWLIPKKRIFTDAPDTAFWRDIRLWASFLIALQLTLYVTFT